MEAALAGYVRALRAAGAEASTAETLDATRAVALLGYAARDDLKVALGLALAKSEADKRIHERVFDLYFSAPAAAPSPDAESGPQAADGAAPDDLQSLRALAAGAGPDADAAAAQHLQLALGRAAAAVGVDDIRLFTQSAPFTQRMLQVLGMAALESRLLQLLGSAAPEARAQARALESVRATLQRAARTHVDRAFELYGRPASEAFMTEVAVQRPFPQFGRMAPADMERLKAAVARMARKLAARHARQQRVQLRGQLDMRRTLRANAGHDGVPYTLAFKQRRRDRPRVVAVCDVSGSVAAQVRFLLLFLYALHDEFGHVVGNLRSFAFSSHLQEVSAPLEQLPFDDAMVLILKEVGMGSTDYGRAWAELHARHLDAIDRRTTLLVLGDGRSNGTDPRLDCFAELAQRAKRVVWLCPEVPGRWGSGDSALLQYRPYCTSMTHCATAQDLERVIDEVLEAYH